MTHSVAHFDYIHCDVFASDPYSGNNLAVVPDSSGLNGAQMQVITQELRHFESIFLWEKDGSHHARVFDQNTELPFAGHPLIGAACALHRQSGDPQPQIWPLVLQGDRRVLVETELLGAGYLGTLDQGRPDFIAPLPDTDKPAFARAFNLHPDQMSPLPLEVVSTGLRYLVIPVTGGLAEARITIPDLQEQLATHGAEFAYLFDVTTFEGRHWENDGSAEDVATGSAAGVIGAYALKHGLVASGHRFVLKQGQFMNRPSQLHVTAYGSTTDVTRITVAGKVAFVGTGSLIAP
ncbi:PhzF family phenazine biosynthesis protein [Falsiruegeria litorea]|uniref:PhzF family phenazine biosynthesis protein n=1 Tax=Falsiruegeria litorea TaxID=1280831 RepID=UPI001BFDE975|nr:PhzF family phenazine biosynthesis protein [Falsiruegeria litorea]MBT8170915.1 PhzF family phenazine biosynthesis protein [Falsiruegeria litorea]